MSRAIYSEPKQIGERNVVVAQTGSNGML
jgi:hypothetical protein